MTGHELREWRRRRGLTQEGLAQHLGVITLTVTRWELENRVIPSFLPLALEGLEKHLKEKSEMERQERLEGNLTKINSLADAIWSAHLGEGQTMKPESVKEMADMIQTLAEESLGVLRGSIPSSVPPALEALENRMEKEEVRDIMPGIPQNITNDHIRQAAHRIDVEGIPPKKKPRKYQVIVNDNRYPIKLIVSWANEFANGYELDNLRPPEVIAFLLGLGFQVITIEDGLPVDR